MKKMILLLTFIFQITVFSQNILSINSEGMNIKVEKISSNLGVVWGMTFISDEDILFTLKEGKIGILNINNKKIKNIDNVPKVQYYGQGGLLDVQKSPNFNRDKYLYFTYVKNVKGEGVTVLSRAKFYNNELISWKELLVSKSSSDTSRHFGSRITFDENSYIYFSIGDRGFRPNGQDLSTHAGSIIRLNIDGTVPKDNPFVKQKGKLAEIYSFGHRNPQGLFYDKVTKNLWSVEHGPRGGDEINLIQKGKNYGWAKVSYGKEYWNPLYVGEAREKEGIEKPKKVFTPSIAPSSLIVYRGKTFKKWNGDILVGALKLTHLNRIVLNKNNEVIKEERLLKELGERIRDVIQSPKGDLYISTDSGNIYRLTLVKSK